LIQPNASRINVIQQLSDCLRHKLYKKEVELQTLY
ncbi:MAG: hypothetical protein ACI8RT_001408, partial [Candidatus Azotimanducaceae bacterium]